MSSDTAAGDETESLQPPGLLQPICTSLNTSVNPAVSQESLAATQETPFYNHDDEVKRKDNNECCLMIVNSYSLAPSETMLPSENNSNSHDVVSVVAITTSETDGSDSSVCILEEQVEAGTKHVAGENKAIAKSCSAARESVNILEIPQRNLHKAPRKSIFDTSSDYNDREIEIVTQEERCGFNTPTSCKEGNGLLFSNKNSRFPDSERSNSPVYHKEDVCDQSFRKQIDTYKNRNRYSLGEYRYPKLTQNTIFNERIEEMSYRIEQCRYPMPQATPVSDEVLRETAFKNSVSSKPGTNHRKNFRRVIVQENSCQDRRFYENMGAENTISDTPSTRVQPCSSQGYSDMITCDRTHIPTATAVSGAFIYNYKRRSIVLNTKDNHRYTVAPKQRQKAIYNVSQGSYLDCLLSKKELTLLDDVLGSIVNIQKSRPQGCPSNSSSRQFLGHEKHDGKDVPAWEKHSGTQVPALDKHPSAVLEEPECWPSMQYARTKLDNLIISSVYTVNSACDNECVNEKELATSANSQHSLGNYVSSSQADEKVHCNRHLENETCKSQKVKGVVSPTRKRTEEDDVSPSGSKETLVDASPRWQLEQCPLLSCSVFSGHEAVYEIDLSLLENWQDQIPLVAVDVVSGYHIVIPIELARRIPIPWDIILGTSESKNPAGCWENTIPGKKNCIASSSSISSSSSSSSSLSSSRYQKTVWKKCSDRPQKRQKSGRWHFSPTSKSCKQSTHRRRQHPASCTDRGQRGLSTTSSKKLPRRGKRLLKLRKRIITCSSYSSSVSDSHSSSLKKSCSSSKSRGKISKPLKRKPSNLDALQSRDYPTVNKRECTAKWVAEDNKLIAANLRTKIVTCAVCHTMVESAQSAAQHHKAQHGTITTCPMCPASLHPTAVFLHLKRHYMGIFHKTTKSNT
ncbi:uncharacterized protein [Procambarus clarkii]|uniref:uncharacterized protein n=1 Tax=Procambarus clarkii TaxID=6728 RepID=UPI0037428D55